MRDDDVIHSDGQLNDLLRHAVFVPDTAHHSGKQVPPVVAAHPLGAPNDNWAVDDKHGCFYREAKPSGGVGPRGGADANDTDDEPPENPVLSPELSQNFEAEDRVAVETR